MTKGLCLYKTLDSMGLSGLPRGYIHVDGLYLQCKHLLLQNHLTNKIQIACGEAMSRGIRMSGSHDQGGHNAHIW